MLEFVLSSCLGIIYLILIGIYLRWFFANARGIGRILGWSCALRAAILLLFLFWVLPAYEQLMYQDADGYYQGTLEYAELLAKGQWEAISPGLGTDMMGFIGALIYLPTRAWYEGMFAISVLFGIAGASLFWAAMVLWRGRDAAYGFLLMIMFWPSLLHFTDAFGKDSIAFLAMGLVAHGYSRLCHASMLWRPLVELLGGLLLLGSIRPHYAIIVVAALVIAEIYNLSVKRSKAGKRSVLVLTAMLFLSPLVWIAVVQVAAGTGEGSVQERILAQSENTATGGSAIDTPQANSLSEVVLGFPSAIIRVLFRPWLWEAHNSFALLAALENTVLLFLTFWRWRSVLRNLRNAVRSVFGVHCLAMLILLMLFNSTHGNLGLLARTKTLFLPYLFAVAAVPMAEDLLSTKRRRRVMRGFVSTGHPAA